MRLGIFGGSFDPIHLGHLLLGECCLEQLQLDQVDFVPAAQSPHKLARVPTAADKRCEMIRLAIGGHPRFHLNTLEVDRGGVSYTVDTLRMLTEQQPDRKLILLMGADALSDFPKWKEPAEICQLCDLAVVQRPGSDPIDFSLLRPIAPSSRLAEFEQLVVQMPQIDISSRELRERVGQGRSIRYQTPPAVEQYILSHQLYRGDDSR